MAIRKRIIYQSQAVMVSGVVLEGVQSASYGLDIAREDVNQYGQLGAVDRVILEAPTSTAEVTMYASGITKGNLQKLLSGSLIGGDMAIAIALDGEGADYDTSTEEVVHIESGYLTSFSCEASVGAIPTMTLGFEGTTLTYGTTPNVPAPLTTNVKKFPLQQDVSITLTTATNLFKTRAQTVTNTFELGLEPLQQLGTKFAFARVPAYPASASLTVEALAVSGHLGVALNGALSQKASAGSASSADGLMDVTCAIGGYQFKYINASLDSVSFDSSIGDNATCSATWSASIGGTQSDSLFKLV